MIHHFFKFLRDEVRAVAAVELALIAPIILTLILLSVEIGTYLIAHQRISRASYTISNLMTQMDEGLTEGQVSDMMLSLDEVSQPFNLTEDGIATVTAIIGVGTDGAVPDSYRVAWTRCFGDNNMTANGSYGSKGDTVADSLVPANMIVTTSQILVVTEVAYNFESPIGLLDLSTEIQYASFFRPRLGAIEDIIADGTSGYTCW